MTTDFRKIDIDRLDPDSVVNSVPEVTPSGVTLSDAQQTQLTVKQSLQSGNTESALRAALANPPYGSDESTKDTRLAAVLQVLVSTRSSEIDTLVKGLSSQDRVVLVKYLYKAMSTSQGQANGATLLTWMEKTFAIAGQGAVIRHITDRRTV